MSQKKKHSENATHEEHHDEEILMSGPEKGSTYSMALYIRSFLVIAVVVIMFLISCHFAFMILDLLTPLLKVVFGLFFAYLLVTHEHFQNFRHTLFNPAYGPQILWRDFLKGFDCLIGDYLGKDWLDKARSKISK